MIRIYAYLAAALVLAGGAWWLHAHLIDEGIERQKHADALALAEWQKKADDETKRLHAKAEEASHAHDQELTDLRQYRADHPLHGRLSDALCHRAAVPETPGTLTGNAQASPAAAAFLAMPERNSGGSDQLNLLDLLAGRADEVSSQLREWQARN